MLRSAMPVLLACTMLGASAPIVGAQTTSSPDSAAVLQQLVTDFNMNDHAAIMSMFTDNAIVSGGPCNNEAQGNECIGRAQIAKSVNENSGPLNVSLRDVQVVGNGNVVTFRTYEVFPLPPEAQAAGIERMVETGTAVIQDGKVDRLALVIDVTDPQTVVLQHIFASLGPPSDMPQSGMTTDGQTLAMQSTATQAMFRVAYGDQAGQQWAAQHQATLKS